MDESSRRSIFKTLFPYGYWTDFKIIVLSSIPLILNNFSQVLLTMISFAFCGRIGHKEFTAVVLATTFINICGLSILVGLGTAAETLFPQIFGGMNRKKMGLVLQRGVIISLIACFPVACVLLNAKHLLKLFVHQENIDEVAIADKYLIYYSWSIVFYSIHTLLHRFIQSQNIFYPVLFVNTITLAFNAGLHALFIFVFEMGVIGAALGNLISNLLVLVFTLIYIAIKWKYFKQSWPGLKTNCLHDWTEYLKLAMPGLAMVFFEWSNFEIGIILATKLGSKESSVMSIAIQAIYLAFLIPLGIGISTNIRIGQLLGENSPEKAKNAGKVALTISICTTTITSLTLYFTSSYIPRIFVVEEDIIELAGDLLKITAVAHIFDSMQTFCSGILRALGAQMYALMIIVISYYLVGLPLGGFLMFKSNLKNYGFWIGVIVAIIILIAQQLFFILRVDWKKKAQEAHDASQLMTHVEQLTSNLKSVDTKLQLLEATNKDVEDEERAESVDETKSLKKKRRASLALKIGFTLFMMALFVAALFLRHFLENKLPDSSSIDL